ncbi:MAG: hypothetical protein IIA02_07355 [Proteobacteria bacterium]|uniref:hypothetical protein n=1 Tax=Aquabacterium sp. TaxID=1872578 RepID=UPI0035C6D578|nr:hypothetical protein [Pseudomonadota bacterium]
MPFALPPSPHQPRRSTHGLRLLAMSTQALALALAGCASRDTRLPSVPDLPSVPAVATVKPTTKESAVTERVGQAAITPLSDLNVVQEEIPAALQAAAQGPYAAPKEPGCAAILTEIHALDDALGADLDDPKGGDKPSLLSRGTDLAENAGVSAVRRTVEGFVPFRSWLRKLSGAEKHSKQVAAAITAGGIRRAYLKGRGDALACPRPGTTADVAKGAAPAASAATSPATPPTTTASASAASAVAP